MRSRTAAPVRRRTGLRIAVSVAAAAAVATTVVIVDPGSGSTSGGTSGTSGGSRPTVRVNAVTASEVLNRAAAQAGPELPRHPRGDQYFYTRELVVQTPVNGGPTRTYHPESWMSVDLKHASWINEVNNPHLEPPQAGAKRWPTQDYDELNRMSRDPLRMVTQLVRPVADLTGPGGRPKPPSSWSENDRTDVYMAVSLLLRRSQPMPPGLRATAFRALALIPGLRVEQNMKDASGRSGVGIASDLIGPDQYLIFDRTTYEYLGQRDVYNAGKGTAHTRMVVQLISLEAVGVVDHLKQRPSGARG